MHRTLQAAISQIQAGNATQYPEFLELSAMISKCLEISIFLLHTEILGHRSMTQLWVCAQSAQLKTAHTTGSSNIPKETRSSFTSLQNLTIQLTLKFSLKLLYISLLKGFLGTPGCCSPCRPSCTPHLIQLCPSCVQGHCAAFHAVAAVLHSRALLPPLLTDIFLICSTLWKGYRMLHEVYWNTSLLIILN